MTHSHDPHAERGEILEGVLILIALSIIIFLFILPGRGVYPSESFYKLQNQPAPGLSQNSGRGNATGPAKTSSYSRSITLGSGDASYEIQPANEYITITNNSTAAVDITGWKLENSKGTRTYAVGSSEQSFASDIVIIPKAPAVVPASGSAGLEDVVLKPGDRAVITTGSIGLSDPYRITSFKENECSGYLDSLPNYSFTPSLGRTCVAPISEPGASSLDPNCQKFLRTLTSCQTPTYNDTVTDSHGQPSTCNGCVNKVAGLSSSCVAFIQGHYGYSACLANHAGDPNFFGHTWHIFLGRTWEMWGKSPETISLYDQYGKLVDDISY